MILNCENKVNTAKISLNCENKANGAKHNWRF